MKYQYCSRLDIKLMFDSKKFVPVVIKSHESDKIPFLCEKDRFDDENYLLVNLYLLSLTEEGYYITPQILTESQQTEELCPIPNSNDELILNQSSEFSYWPIPVRPERKSKLEILHIEEIEE